MKKKINIVLKVCIIICICIVTLIFITLFKGDMVEINGEITKLTPLESVIISTVGGFSFGVVTLLFPPINIAVIYLFYQRIIKNRIRTNSKYANQNINYCRDNLNKLSPGIISFLKDFNIEFEKDISAHILKLLYEKHLIEENNEIKPVSNSADVLTDADIIAIKIVEQQKFSIDLKNEYEKAVFDEAMKDGLIAFKNKQLEKVFIKFFIGIVINILLFLVSFTIFSIKSHILLSILIILLITIVSILPFVLIIYLVTSLVSLFKYKTTIVRTPKGNKIFKNSLGLHKFLKDFGNFEQMNYQYVYVRDYFLIYSVIFGINKKIPKEIIYKIEHQ